jgi:nucleotide-binding universal stress UspA family protein
MNLTTVRGPRFLAPTDPTAQFRAILVPVDGSHASLQAIALASDIARKSKGKVYVVHVIEVKRTLPLDAPMEPEEAAADDILQRAEEVARKQGFQIEAEILHAREAGPAIVDEAIERGADLIILGIEYNQPFGEFELSKLAQYTLRNAPCEVWICRHNVAGGAS